MNYPNKNSFDSISFRNIFSSNKSKSKLSSQMKNIIYNNELELFYDYENMNKLFKFNKYVRVSGIYSKRL
jgi:hypothetical protein